ncbi:hypothetical protein ABFV54_26380, partial [Pseudomonas syringae]|uniref:hypothetical protein n=1 Tax=Pseudomonas syringae TaxID=317 RepID=UPI0034D9973F
GGADSTKLTDNNIGVVANGTDGLEVKLAKDVNLGSDGSVTAGNTSLNNSGLTTTDSSGNTATLTGSGTSIQGKDGSSASYVLAGTTLKDTSGNTNSTTPTGSTVTDKTGNSSETTAAGTTVTAKDANGNTTGQTTYGSDGFSIKDGPSVSKDGVNAANTVIS